MSYNLYITRGEEPHSATGTAIAEEEWAALANSRPELVEGGSFSGPGDESRVIYMLKVPGMDEASLYWDMGEVVVTGLYEEGSTSFVSSLAAELGARLLGAEGESY